MYVYDSQHSGAFGAHEGSGRHVDVGGAPLTAVEATLVLHLRRLELAKAEAVLVRVRGSAATRGAGRRLSAAPMHPQSNG